MASKLSGLSFSDATAMLEPLVLFVAGMVVYSIFVFKFYEWISKKYIFALKDGGNSSAIRKIVFAFKYVFLFPLTAFLWFFVIAVLLAVLSKVLMIGDIFMISMALTTTIRITAYYSEELSNEIAKLIPFALLAVFLLDIKGISIGVLANVIWQISSVFEVLVYYFSFLVVLELVLRFLDYIRNLGDSDRAESPDTG